MSSCPKVGVVLGLDPLEGTTDGDPRVCRLTVVGVVGCAIAGEFGTDPVRSQVARSRALFLGGAGSTYDSVRSTSTSRTEMFAPKSCSTRSTASSCS